MVSNKSIIKVTKYIDYCYISNYIENSMNQNIQNSINKNIQLQNEWKIFSIHSNIEQINILYLLQLFISQQNFDMKKFVLSIYVYKQICINFAHLIDNYTSLFGTIYITINNTINKEFLSEILNIDILNIKNMIYCIEKYMKYNYNYLFYNDYEEINIINSIKYL
jgi:hypothetical protein